MRGQALASNQGGPRVQDVTSLHKSASFKGSYSNSNGAKHTTMMCETSSIQPTGWLLKQTDFYKKIRRGSYWIYPSHIGKLA